MTNSDLDKNEISDVSLSGKEICDIIKALAKSNVTDFQYGSLRITTGQPQPNLYQPEYKTEYTRPEYPIRTIPHDLVEEETEMSPSELKEHRDEYASEYLEHLELTDPDRLEQIIANGVTRD